MYFLRNIARSACDAIEADPLEHFALRFFYLSVMFCIVFVVLLSFVMRSSLWSMA